MMESVGDCPSCGKTVRYVDYVPHNYLCLDCGGERPHATGVTVGENGVLDYNPEEADR